MNIETEQLKLKLIETQVALLQYQHRDVLANIEALTKAQATNIPLDNVGRGGTGSPQGLST